MKCLVDNETKCFCEGVTKSQYNAEVLPLLNAMGTYIIDSQQKFGKWEDNVAGNDYTHIVICGGCGAGENGEYLLSTYFNLTTKGTKTIQGVNGAKIKSSTFLKNLYYDVAPTGNDYWIRDVEFITEYIDNSEKTYFLKNCINLTNCKVTCTLRRQGYGNPYSAIKNCNNLTNCEVIIIDGSTGGNFSSYAFNNCTNLNSCSGNGVAVGTGVGYGFNNCNAVSYCKKSAVCTNAVFYNSYASWAEDATYICADTANGGFNNTDNT